MRAVLLFSDGKPIEIGKLLDDDATATIRLFHGSEPVEQPILVPLNDGSPRGDRWNIKLEVTLTPSEPITVDSSTIEVPAVGTRRQFFQPIYIKPPNSLTICWTLNLGDPP